MTKPTIEEVQRVAIESFREVILGDSMMQHSIRVLKLDENTLALVYSTAFAQGMIYAHGIIEAEKSE